MSTRDLVVDSDITTLNDDAFALYYLVALGRVPAVVTTVFGNTSARLSAEAARALFVDTSVTVEVHAGSEHPLEWSSSTQQKLRQLLKALPDGTYLGTMSADDSDFWRPATGESTEALELATFLDQSPACDILALGPTRNIAGVVRQLRPETLRRHRLFISGGALQEGNVTQTAEFNAFADPDSLQVCLSASWDQLTIVPLEVTGLPRLRVAEASRIREARTPFGRALDDLERRSPRDSLTREPVWDVIAAMILANELPVQAHQATVRVRSDGWWRGTTEISSVPGPHRVVTAVDPVMAIQRFEATVGAPAQPL